MRTITLTPAYGRDYSSKANVLADWDANKDFVIQDIRLSGYVNKAQVPDLIRDGISDYVAVQPDAHGHLLKLN
jgi:hypothetical protein